MDGSPPRTEELPLQSHDLAASGGVEHGCDDDLIGITLACGTGKVFSFANRFVKSAPFVAEAVVETGVSAYVGNG
jgi:hypothetical protein